LKIFLDINDAGKLLDTVEKDISLLDGRLVLIVLGIRAVSLHNSTDFVDPTMQPTSSNETSQFPSKIKKIL